MVPVKIGPCFIGQEHGLGIKRIQKFGRKFVMRCRHTNGYDRNEAAVLAQIGLRLGRYDDCAAMERLSKKYEMVKIALAILGNDIGQ